MFGLEINELVNIDALQIFVNLLQIIPGQFHSIDIYYIVDTYMKGRLKIWLNSVTNSNIAVGEILEVLSISKTAVKNTYHPGGTVTYIISIVNSGTTPITGLTLTDDLGAYAFSTTSLTPLTYLDNTVKYYTNGTLQAVPAVTAGPPLVFSGLTVPANGNLTLVYETAVNQYAPLTNESFITNTVTASGDGITSITAKETVNAEALPLLGITKSISPVPVTENGSLTYTFLQMKPRP